MTKTSAHTSLQVNLLFQCSAIIHIKNNLLVNLEIVQLKGTKKGRDTFFGDGGMLQTSNPSWKLQQKL